MSILILITATGAFALTVQKVINAKLGEAIGSLEGSWVNHLIGAIAALLLLLIGFRSGSFDLVGIPWPFFLGGILGVFLIYFINAAIPAIGAVAVLNCVILSQLVCSSFVDHFGLLGADATPLSLAKIGGTILILCGVKLVLPKG